MERLRHIPAKMVCCPWLITCKYPYVNMKAADNDHSSQILRMKGWVYLNAEGQDPASWCKLAKLLWLPWCYTEDPALSLVCLIAGQDIKKRSECNTFLKGARWMVQEMEVPSPPSEYVASYSAGSSHVGLSIHPLILTPRNGNLVEFPHKISLHLLCWGCQFQFFFQDVPTFSAGHSLPIGHITPFRGSSFKLPTQPLATSLGSSL